MILIRQIEKVPPFLEGLDGRLDAHTTLINLAAETGTLPIDKPVVHLVFGTVHHGAHGQPPPRHIQTGHVDGPTMGDHEDDGSVPLKERGHMLPPFDVKTRQKFLPGQKRGLGKGQKGLGTNADRVMQQ